MELGGLCLLQLAMGRIDLLSFVETQPLGKLVHLVLVIVPP